MKARGLRLIVLIVIALAAATWAFADDPNDLPEIYDTSGLPAAFSGAQKVDLRTSKVSSVVTLREVIKIPPPATQVLVKTFDRNTMPDVLRPAFPTDHIVGVTVGGKYIAIVRTPFYKEYNDTLRHELVHAYITMASPGPLPFWFQEGSAVYFSTDKDRKFYGQPSSTQVGVMVGREVEISDVYKQKLQSFHFLVDMAGKEKFYKWYRHAVLSGDTDARPLLGIDPGKSESATVRKGVPVWLIGALAVVIAAICVIGYYSSRRGGEYL